MFDQRPVVATPSLNPQQQEAVECEDSVLVLSGAGTGKTRVIVERVRRLLDQGVEPREILAITYTNKAAIEMRNRLGKVAHRMMACTFHSFGMRFLVQQPNESGLGRDFLILDEEDQRQMVRRVLLEDMGLPKHSDGGPKPRDVQRFITDMKEKGRRPENVAGNPNKVAVEAYFNYEERRRSQSKADFAELLLRSSEILNENATIREKWSSKFKYILIDELQDINQLQFDILRLLRRKNTIFFGVGDDDQSIYRFRGALPGMLSRFRKEFTEDNILRLERNYRSTERILHLANDIIGQNFGRLGKNLHGRLGDGILPSLTRYSSDEEEARSVARDIAVMRDNNIPLSEICILYRNNVLSQLFESQLSGQGLNYRVYGGQQYFARAEVKDVVAYLSVAVNSNNIEAVVRSVNNPVRGFGGKSQQRLINEMHTGRDLLDILQASSHVGARDYVAIIKQIKKHADNDNVNEAVKQAVYGSGLHKHFVESREQERADHIEELINIAARYVNDSNNPSLADFLRMATLDQEKDEDNKQGKVTLMTIHRAKGLEFKRVFLIGLEQMIIPVPDADDDTIAEERRLLYVAVTRAQHELRMSYTSMRRRRGTMHRSSITMLLRNINEDLVSLENGATLDDSASHRNFLSKMKDNDLNPSAENKVLGKYVVGNKVKSEKFGLGVVLALDGEGEKKKALVLFFRDKKRRWLVLELANLTVTAR